jgi:uncharacterized membrane protein YkvA (DUF1232 family)
MRDYNAPVLQQFKDRARALQTETVAIYLAALDPRTPWYVKGLLLLIVAYAFSPIDLIPDFIPVLGYLDDLLIIPAGITLALRMIPAEVMADARTAAQTRRPRGRIRLLGAGIIVVIWILAIILVISWIRRWLALPR